MKGATSVEIKEKQQMTGKMLNNMKQKRGRKNIYI